MYVCMYVCMYIYTHTYTFIGISGNHEQAGVSFQALGASSELRTAKAIEYILGYTQNVLSDKMMINHGIWKIYQICIHIGIYWANMGSSRFIDNQRITLW